MKLSRSTFLFVFVAWFALVSSHAVSGAVQTSQPAVPTTDDEAVVTKVCSGCHASDSAKDSRRSRDQWEEVVAKMVERGAMLTDKEYEAVMRVLIGRYGRVAINTAPAGEIIEVLGLTSDEAERIVKYRSSNGPFADFDALAKVPDVETEKLKTNRAGISF